jgi:hypothetical protein
MPDSIYEQVVEYSLNPSFIGIEHQAGCDRLHLNPIRQSLIAATALVDDVLDDYSPMPRLHYVELQSNRISQISLCVDDLMSGCIHQSELDFHSPQCLSHARI